jgi:hypothetical protein
MSPSIIIHSGVPQGSVLSLSLFNFFNSDFPLLAPLSHSFANDFYSAASSFNFATIAKTLNENMALVEAWAVAKKLTIAPHKSTITLFTLDPHQSNVHPQVFYKGEHILLDKTPKWLGINVDSRINSSYHATDLDARLSRQIQIIRALSGTSFGQSKEVLLMTYKMLLCPLMTP